MKFDKTRWSYEKEYGKVFSIIAGGDEAGRGSLAGPVFSALVVLEPEAIHPEIDDSKKLKARKREELFRYITTKATAWAIGMASEAEIDKLNILQATKLAFKRAYDSMSVKPGFLLLDALNLEMLATPQCKIFQGDQKSYSIAAASILAKVARDAWMDDLHREYPEYHFSDNKGYGSALHRQVLAETGMSPVHRKSFQLKSSGGDTTQLNFTEL